MKSLNYMKSIGQSSICRSHQTQKRIFDFTFALIGVIVFTPIIILLIPLATISTGAPGVFRQRRIGRYGKPFYLYKLRTMRNREGTTVTTSNDTRVTRLGRWLRKGKLDELPRLFNVLFGEMSFVGPRPDVAGFADKLTGKDLAILDLRPGITGPATIKYKNEEEILGLKDDPEEYNRSVIWPDKVQINLNYIENWSIWNDLVLLFATVGLVRTPALFCDQYSEKERQNIDD